LVACGSGRGEDKTPGKPGVERVTFSFDSAGWLYVYQQLGIAGRLEDWKMWLAHVVLICN
jgi:hypothetical protein